MIIAPLFTVSGGLVVPPLFLDSLDTVPPTITLVGPSVVTVAEGDAWFDPGASAMDSVDGSVPVLASGVVDTLQVGQYTRTYTAVDSAGNSTTRTRTIIVASVVVVAPEELPPPHRMVYATDMADGIPFVGHQDPSDYVDWGLDFGPLMAAGDSVQSVVALTVTGGASDNSEVINDMVRFWMTVTASVPTASVMIRVLTAGGRILERGFRVGVTQLG